MAEKISKYQKLQKKYISKTKPFFKEKDAKEVYDAIATGENYYLRRDTVETSAFDSTWIANIEDALGDIGEIIKDPKKITKTIENLVPVELAKKTNAVSVRHLASHTQYIKEIKENGDVVPSKILSIESDDEYATYENRFVATLIRRLVLFVEKRYDFIMKYAPLKSVEEMKIKTKTIIDGSMVEIESTVRVTKPSDYAGIDDNNKFIDRISQIRHYLRYYYTSSFMKMMKNEKDVRSPIIMTNILRKNPKYNKCYRLYKFVETYDGLGVSYSLSGGYLKLDEKNIEEINAALMANFLALRAADPSKKAAEINKTHKPKVLKSEEDELFEFNSKFKGPIEFIRVDEQYRNLIETLTKMPRSMRKEEEEYNSETRLENREKRIFKDLTNRLISRRKKEVSDFDKKAKGIVAKREKDEAERKRKQEEALRKERERIEREARKLLVEQAKQDFRDITVDNKRIDEENKRLEEEAKHLEAEEALRQAALEEARRQEEESQVIEEPLENEVIEQQLVEEPVEEVEQQDQVEEAPEEPVVNEVQNEENTEETPVEEENEEPKVVPESEPIEEQPVKTPIEEFASLEGPQEEAMPEETPVEEPAPEKVKKPRKPRAKKSESEKKPRKPRAKKAEENTTHDPIEETPIKEEPQSTPTKVWTISKNEDEEAVIEQIHIDSTPKPVKEEHVVKEPLVEDSTPVEEPLVEPQTTEEVAPEKVKKPRKPRAKKSESEKKPRKPRVKKAEETPNTEPEPVEEVKPVEVEELSIEETKPIEEEPQETPVDESINEEVVLAPEKVKKPRKPRAKKTDEKPSEEVKKPRKPRAKKVQDAPAKEEKKPSRPRVKKPVETVKKQAKPTPIAKKEHVNFKPKGYAKKKMKRRK